jgi:hypothetical protein
VVAERGVVPRPYRGLDGFDGLVAVGVLNYVPHLGDALRWMRQRVRPGGYAVFTVPSVGPAGHLSRLTARLSRKSVYPTSGAEVRRALASAGFEVRQIVGAGSAGASGRWWCTPSCRLSRPRGQPFPNGSRSRTNRETISGTPDRAVSRRARAPRRRRP